MLRALFYVWGIKLALAAVTVMDFVAMEVCGRMGMLGSGAFAASRHRTLIAVVRVEVIIHMSPEVFGAVEPWACSDEGTPGKPFRAIVAVRSTAVGSCLVIAVRTIRGCTDADADLSLSAWGGSRETDAGHSGQRKQFNSIHWGHLIQFAALS
jgi:hypothetical protein